MTYQLKNTAKILPTDIVFSDEVASLADGEEIDSGYIDCNKYGKLQVTVKADTIGLTYRQSLKSTESGNEEIISIPLVLANNTFNFPIRSRFIRIQIQNNSGGILSNTIFEIKASDSLSDGMSVSPLSGVLVAQSQAALTRSVIAGQPIGSDDATAVFRNVSVNQGSALLTADFGTEIARGLVSGYRLNKKFGRNADIDTASTPEDVWNGGGIYTGFNCTAAQTLEFFSDNAADSGSLVSSGTATGGSNTSLIDTEATFVTDGVSVGDVVINDTQKIHGFISAVTETNLTVFRMYNGVLANEENVSGDTYRIVTASSTGAAVCKFSGMLNGDYVENSEYVIMNGTSAVDSVGTYLRQSRGQVVLSGSSDTNAGEITGRQKTTTANVTMVIPSASGQTAICAATVPAGKIWIIKSLEIQMARSGGQAGSANCRFLLREIGGSWKTKRFVTISNSANYQVVELGAQVAQEFTDLKWNVEGVSDNNTTVTAEFEYFEIDV